MPNRVIRYLDRRYGLKRALESIADWRQKPHLPTFSIVAGLFFVVMMQLGSLNAIEQALKSCPRGCIWPGWVGGKLPSADRLGEVAALLDIDQLRAVLLDHYHQRRRKKTLRPFAGKWWVLVLDGHEMGASYLRQCPGCSKRTVKVRGGEAIQSFHRYVLAYLLGDEGGLLLDLEMQGPGEAEMPAARRLLRRLLRTCPRAFGVVAGDALYLEPALCKDVLAAGKDFIAVLKNENRDLLVDFRQLQELAPKARIELGTRACQCQDIEGLETWPQVGRAVRVVSSDETHTVVRQRTGKAETTQSTWVWATSLSAADMGTPQLVQLGHKRWDIENRGFNELVTEWHADHVYHHNVKAMTAILLLTFLAYNLFHVWHSRNLRPEVTAGHSVRFFARLLQAEFLASLRLVRTPP